MTPRKVKSKVLVKWAGFCNGRLDITKEDNNGYRIYAIFPNKETAKLCYEDVRKVTIQQLPSKKGKR